MYVFMSKQTLPSIGNFFENFTCTEQTHYGFVCREASALLHSQSWHAQTPNKVLDFELIWRKTKQSIFPV
jgi:hypothetical protein